MVNSMTGLSCAAVLFTFEGRFSVVMNEPLRPAVLSAVAYVFPDKGNLTIVYIAFYVLLFLAGSVAPDLDNRKKGLRLPGRHRTWTHSIWTIVLLGFLSTKLYWLWYFTAGWALHVLGDSFSRGGVCWFYPLSRYRVYPSGAQVKRGRHIWLYRVGRPSEGVFVALVCIAHMAVIIWAMVNGGWNRLSLLLPGW